MAIERMLTEEMPARVLVARVLAEAGIEYVFGISGGHTGRIVSGLSQVQNQVRMVTVREESLAGVMAEVYGRLTRRPGVMLGQGPWVLGNGLIGVVTRRIYSHVRVRARQDARHSGPLWSSVDRHIRIGRLDDEEPTQGRRARP